MKKIIEFFFYVIQRCLFPWGLFSFLKNKRKELRSYWIRGVFKSCPRSVRFGIIGDLQGPKYISVADKVCFADWIYLTAWETYGEQKFTPALSIGKHCNFGAFNHISCINKIEIGDNCLTGKWVTIVDNDHGKTDPDSLSQPPAHRNIVSKGPVIIGKNVWIGDKATILAGVTIGDGAVVAANTVVTQSVPENCIVVGNPSRIIKR